MRLVEEPALLAQPPVALLPPHLHSPARAQQLAPGASTPPPPWGAGLPASLQTPGPPLLAGWQSPARPPRGLATPSRPGSQLLSPGVWRISRGGTTPLPSPAPAGACVVCVVGTGPRQSRSMVCALSSTHFRLPPRAAQHRCPSCRP